MEALKCIKYYMEAVVFTTHHSLILIAEESETNSDVSKLDSDRAQSNDDFLLGGICYSVFHKIVFCQLQFY